MINIAKLLKDAPKGMKLYSPLLGEVEFAEVMNTDYMPIRVIKRGYGLRFDKYGRYMGSEYPDGECLLFPRKDYRTWNGWTPYIEPKFKVGDWVVRKDKETFYGGNYAEQITLIEVDEKGKCIWLSSTSWVNEDDIRLWIIADAKDGDVLANDNGWTCIFKAFDGCTFSSYCFMDSQKWFCEVGSETHTTDSSINGNIHPATKEQRTLFFKKMQEVGYQWYAGKKELKKIIEPKFKVGDSLQSGCMYAMVRRIDTENQRYVCQFDNIIPFKEQNLWSLVPNPKPHYDISNFKPFDKVLVRDSDNLKWTADLFSYIDDSFVCIGGIPCRQCIPFEGNEHLLGTTNPCDKQYINW